MAAAYHGREDGLRCRSERPASPWRIAPMRRQLRLVACTATVLAVALIAWHTRRTAAEPATPSTGRTAKTGSPQLPIAQVVLFSSGVGYFQREGDVEGNGRTTRFVITR